MTASAKRTLLIGFLVAAQWAGLLCAGEASPDRQAKLLLQALSFDRNLATRTTGGYLILVVHAPVGAARPARELADAFEKEAAERHPQIGLRMVTHPWGRIMPLNERIHVLGVDAIYVHRSAERFLPQLLDVANKVPLPTMGGYAELAEKGVGLTVIGVDEPLLGVNREAAEGANLDLPSSLLKVARILEP